MADISNIKPSSTLMTVGSMALVFLIALAAVWAINNNATLQKWTAKKA